MDRYLGLDAHSASCTAAVEVLLLALLAPYLFYCRKYEETTRRMMREAFLLENARLLAGEDGEAVG